MQRSLTRLAWFGVLVLSAVWVVVVRWRLRSVGYDGPVVWPDWAVAGVPAAMAGAVLCLPTLRASRAASRVGVCTAVALLGVTVYASVVEVSIDEQSCFGPQGACDEVLGR